MSNPFSDVVGFFEGLYTGTWNFGGTIANAITGWFTSTAGSIATAIESGFLSIFKDLWDVIIGPLEVIVGAILIIMAIVFLTKDDLAQVATAFAMLPK